MSRTQKTPTPRRGKPKREDDRDEAAVVPFRASDPLESTIPPTPLRDLLAAEGASIYVFTDTHALLATVEEAGGEQYPVFAAESWPALREALQTRRCGIVLLDIDAISGALIDRVTELTKLNPALVTLVASTREHADGLLNLLSQRKIHRLLIKPATVGITRLLLESSVNRYVELRQKTLSGAEGPPAPERRLPGWPAWLLGGGLVLGVLATALLTQTMNRSEPAPVSVRSPASATRPEPEPVPAVVTVPSGPAAVQRSAATTPGTDSAAATGASAVEPAVATVVPQAMLSMPAGASVDPSGTAPVVPAPGAGLDARFGEVEAALIADDLDRAETLLDEIAGLDPSSTRLEFLRAQIGRARIAARDAAAARQAAAAPAPPSELTSSIGLARARLGQQQLIAPAGDSALDYLERARAVSPDAPEVAALEADLGAAMLAAAEIELAGGRVAAAEALFGEAQALGVSDEDLVALSLSLAYARESVERAELDALLARARDAIAGGRLLDTDDGALATLLEVQRRNPEYPALPDAFGVLEDALQDAAEAALAAADWDGAEVTIAALSRAGAPLTTLDRLNGELNFGRQQARYLAEPAPAGELAIAAFEPPVYPNRALARGTEGWVDLEFVVGRDGRPHDVTVTGAEPADEFEAAALASVVTYQFEPFVLDGRSYERRVMLRMRFALQ